MTLPVVARLRIYPFKSLDGADVAAAKLTAGGGFALDRAYAFVDANGGFVNGKSEPLLHRLRVAYDAGMTSATFTHPSTGSRMSFAFGDSAQPLAAWMSEVLGRTVALRWDGAGGFPDDTNAPGPTIVSTATLTTVASWFEGLDVDSVRLRLRANIEVDDAPAFWEDSLLGRPGEAPAFNVGSVAFAAVNPCARCIVPSRDPLTGTPIAAFAKRVSEGRVATMPSWVEQSRFDHFYRLTVNTRLAPQQAGGVVSVGEHIVGGAPTEVFAGS